MSFSSLISTSVIQRLNLYYSLFSLSESSHSSSLLYFYFPFYPSPLISLKLKPFIFPFSCFIVQWIACSPRLSDFFRISCLCVVHSLPPPLSLSFSWLSMQRSWQKPPPTVTVARPTRNVESQDQPSLSHINASANIIRNFVWRCLSWSLQHTCCVSGWRKHNMPKST